MNKVIPALFSLLVFISPAFAFSMTIKPEMVKDSSAVEKFSEAIEDNSFFIEEAYNQEDGVIQHISGMDYSKDNGVFYTFTEEWPFFTPKHQLSATIPIIYDKVVSYTGFGDILINYRYQLFDHDDFITAAPRFSVILPTGKITNGFGNGVTGFQINLPFSKRLSEKFAAHFNLGMTVLPNVKSQDMTGREIKNTLSSYNYGFSIIWLAKYQINFMLEYVGNYNAGFNESGEVEHNLTTIISPGVRYAIDIKDLQIVPGLAVPVYLTNGESKTDMFFYLSFEHPIY